MGSLITVVRPCLLYLEQQQEYWASLDFMDLLFTLSWPSLYQ